MATESRKSFSVWGIVRGFFAILGMITALFGGWAGLADAFGGENVGPAAATWMLRAFGDPCDGVVHPKAGHRGTMVDAVQEYQRVNTGVIYAVEKAAVKDGWAYMETGPLTGPDGGESDSSEYDAFLLQDVNIQNDATEWVVVWDGSVGEAVPGPGPEGNPYPEDFDLPDQDILRCQTACVVGGEEEV